MASALATQDEAPSSDKLRAPIEAPTTIERGALFNRLLGHKELTAHLEHLARAVDRQAADEGFRSMLFGWSKLWQYSVWNHLFILWQRPGATAVAGKRQWERRGRTVREGEKGLVIRAPSGGGGRFVLVDVYDISQTEGPEVPHFELPKGACDELGAIEAAAPKLGLRIQPYLEGGLVAGRSLGGVVEVDPRLPPVSRAGTLIHEYAHELLHQGTPLEIRRRMGHALREAEAEATAYVVLEALGLQSDAPTYVAWTGGSGTMILSSLRRIHAAARAILTAISGKRPRVTIPEWKVPKPPSQGRSRRGRAVRRSRL